MKILTIILGIILVIFGFICLLHPAGTFLATGWLAALFLLIMGVNMIADYATNKKYGTVRTLDLVVGIITLAVGILIMCNFYARFMADIMVIFLFCGWMLVSGVMRIATSIQLKKIGQSWVWALVFGIATLAAGVLLCFSPVVAAFTIAFVISFAILMQGFVLMSLGLGMGARE